MGAAIDPHWSQSNQMSSWGSYSEPILIGKSSSAEAVPLKRAIDGSGAVAAVARKKQRAAPQAAAPPTCQVEGCNADLTGCKGYHRRHRVCEMHSKSPRSIVAGIEQRFCQQCSRFHPLAEFDEGKRSCRRRLAGHNERRRKPPQPDLYSMQSMPIFSGHEKQQHILDGTFLLSSNDGSIWPGFHKPNENRQVMNNHQHEAGLHFYVQNPTKQNLLALRESIATQGVYQFLKCHNATVNQASSSNLVQAAPLTAISPPTEVSMAAPSLLSQERRSSSMMNKPDALLQLSSSHFMNNSSRGILVKSNLNSLQELQGNVNSNVHHSSNYY